MFAAAALKPPRPGARGVLEGARAAADTPQSRSPSPLAVIGSGGVMAGERKSTDEDVKRLRRLHEDERWSLSALAEVFGCSRQHIGRLIRGEQRPVLPGLNAGASDGVSGAVTAFLEGPRPRLV